MYHFYKQQERFISDTDRLISERVLSKFVNSERSEMLCLENGEVYDINESLMENLKHLSMESWIKRNINDFNFRLVYDDNDLKFFLKIGDLQKDTYVMRVDQS